MVLCNTFLTFPFYSTTFQLPFWGAHALRAVPASRQGGANKKILADDRKGHLLIRHENRHDRALEIEHVRSTAGALEGAKEEIL